MKSLKRPLRFALSLLFSVNIAFAEVSGGFVGLEFGGGEVSAKSTMIRWEKPASLEQIELITGFQTTYYGLIVGYKQFFNRYVGLRYYANINALHFSLNPKSCSGNTCNNFAFFGNIAMINYGANIDFMGNFYSGESVDFGGFVGLGIGANSWVGEGLNNHKKQYLDNMNNIYQQNNNPKRFKLQRTGFDCWVNLGLRTNFATHHSIEVAARVPLLKTTLIKDKFHNYNDAKVYDIAVGDGKDYTAHTTIRNIYDLSIRYAVSF